MIEVTPKGVGNRAGWRPLLPSRATYWIWFGLAGILVFGMLPYLFCANTRGLLSWAELWAIEVAFVAGGSVNLAIGLVFRWRWLRRQKAIREYDQMLSSIAMTNGS